MKILRQLLIASTALLVTEGAAHAASVDPIVLEQKGTWTASYHPSNNDGVGMCSLNTNWRSNGSHVASFYMKYIPGRDIFVQLFKIGWAMPKGTPANVSLWFDNVHFLTAKATAGAIGDGQRYLEFRIADADGTAFLKAFADAYNAKLSFPDGNEPAWDADMRGSRETTTAFKVCAAELHKRMAKPTQPTGPQATQPTGPQATQPTQPMKKKDDAGI